jgi:hypothetical protein
MQKKKRLYIAGRIVGTLALCTIIFWLAGCSSRSQSDEQLKQQAAQAAQATQDAQQAAADAKAAAANAERKVNDIAAGVKQGLNGIEFPARLRLNNGQSPYFRGIFCPEMSRFGLNEHRNIKELCRHV